MMIIESVCIKNEFLVCFVCLSSLTRPVILLEDKSFLSMRWKMEFYDPTEKLLQHFENLSLVMTLGENGESICVCGERAGEQRELCYIFFLSLPIALQTQDPRVHFALVCGAKSCPPIKTYTPEVIVM